MMQHAAKSLPIPSRAAALLAGLLSAAALLAPPLAVPARAQDASIEAVVQRLQGLERDLRDLQASVYRGQPPRTAPGGGGSGNVVAADLTVRLTELESQLRDLTGRVEELGHQTRTLSNRLDKLVADVDFRLQELEGRGGGTAAAAAPGQPAEGTTAAVTAPPAAGQGGSGAGQGAGAQTAQNTLPQGTPMDQYNFALSLVRQAKLDDAEGVLRAFLQEHPDNGLAGNAQFWLAEVFYQRKQWDEAARLYLEGYQHYPDNIKAPDMLLKLGMTLEQLSQPAEACGVFDELSKKYPQADNRIQAKLAAERQRAKCS